MSNKIRTRFAPSPTGYLHVGGARTALFSWLFAKHHNGEFVLRIEDTDQERSTDEALQMQLSDLKWLNLDWNEGPEAGGEYGPYRQSERLGIYQECVQKLIQEKKAFHCFCKNSDLETKMEALKKAGLPMHYDGTCRKLSQEEVAVRLEGGEKAVIRFHVSQEKDYVLDDLVRGEVSFPSSMVGDFVILRSDGMPVYNFACAVDDHLMKMTHVFRAEEHLSNSLRQLMIYEAFGWEVPRFGHLSLIMGEDGQKLSKRHGATSCNEYKERGYLPEALTNYLTLLGWSSPSGSEILERELSVKEFDGTRINSSPAIFDEVKLTWMNSVYLRNLSDQELWKRVEPFIAKEKIEIYDDLAWREKSVGVLKTAMETLHDAVDLYRLLSDNLFKVSEKGKETLEWDSSQGVVEKWMDLISKMPNTFMTSEEFEGFQEEIKNSCGVKGKFLFMPIRVAVIGHPQGAEMKQLAPLLKKSSLLDRAEYCLGEM